MKLEELKRIAEAVVYRGSATGKISDIPSQEYYQIGVAKEHKKFIETLTPALALELIGLIEQSRKMAQYYMETPMNLEDSEAARSFLEALRKWEDGR